MNNKMKHAPASPIDQDVKSKIMAMQKGEITEFYIYKKLSQSMKNNKNQELLHRISGEELHHHNIWKKYTGEEPKPNRIKIWLYYLISKVFGLTFSIKMMEGGETKAQEKYAEIGKFVPEAMDIAQEESAHERNLINMIDEDRLKYTGDMARGLNVAVVELTGLLAGLTFVLPEKNLIILTGLIAGLAMIFSVASTEYLGARTGGGVHNPLKAGFYGGLTNAGTVVFLLSPYFIFEDLFASVGFMVFNALVIVTVFSFYISVSKEIPFRKRFSEMVLVSLGVAFLSFGIGYLARIFLHVEI